LNNFQIHKGKLVDLQHAAKNNWQLSGQHIPANSQHPNRQHKFQASRAKPKIPDKRRGRGGPEQAPNIQGIIQSTRPAPERPKTEENRKNIDKNRFR
jgi:hypothetical protein